MTITVEGLDEVEYTEAEEASSEEAQAAVEEAKEDKPEESSEEKTEEAAVEESSAEEPAPQESMAEAAEEESSVQEAAEESVEEAAQESSEAAPAESVPEEVAEETVEESEPSPLDGYVKVSTEISAAAMDAMKADAEKRIRDREAFDMDAGESLESVYFLESIFLVSNDGTDDPKNAVYLIFRLNAKNPNGDFSWYDCFRYSDLSIDEAGNVSVDLETASGLWQRHIAEDNKRAGYYYYTGYETMDEIREFCQTELGDEYSIK